MERHISDISNRYFLLLQKQCICMLFLLFKILYSKRVEENREVEYDHLCTKVRIYPHLFQHLNIWRIKSSQVFSCCGLYNPSTSIYTEVGVKWWPMNHAEHKQQDLSQPFSKN